MKKYVYGALVVLCCPLVLNAQQAFAVEGTDTTESVEVVSEVTSPLEAPVEAPAEEVPALTETTESSVQESTSTEETTTEETTEPVAPEETVNSSEGASEESSAEVPVESTEESAVVEVTEETAEAVEESEEPAMKAAAEEAVTVNLTVNYVLADGTPVATGAYSGLEGEMGYVEVPTGYMVSGISDASFFSSYDAATGLARVYGTLSAAVPTITVTVVSSEESSVLFNFVDEEGNPIVGQSSVLQTGTLGEAYTFTAPAITGYTAPAQATYTGTYGAGVTVVDVVYTRVQSTVTVSYVDEAGNTLLPSDTITSKFGDVYEVTPASFYGMELVSMNGQPITEADLPIEVTFTEQDQSFVFVYRETTSTLPVAVTPPVTDSVIDPVGEAAPVTKQIVAPLEQPISKQVLLPETGEQEVPMTVTFVGAILAVQALYLFKKKKEDELNNPL